jgi:hypothetical protein
MTDGRLWLDPVRAIDGARHLARAGAHLAAQRAHAGAELDTMSAARPWGNDDIGAAFHQQYAPIAAHVLVAWEGLAAHLEDLAAAAARSVQVTQHADDEAGTRITHAYGKH